MRRISPQTHHETRQKNPAPSRAHDAMGRAIWSEGSLPMRLKELLRLRSAQLAKCQH